jgi:hypothetical protein
VGTSHSNDVKTVPKTCIGNGQNDFLSNDFINAPEIEFKQHVYKCSHSYKETTFKTVPITNIYKMTMKF